MQLHQNAKSTFWDKCKWLLNQWSNIDIFQSLDYPKIVQLVYFSDWKHHIQPLKRGHKEKDDSVADLIDDDVWARPGVTQVC